MSGTHEGAVKGWRTRRLNGTAPRNRPGTRIRAGGSVAVHEFTPSGSHRGIVYKVKTTGKRRRDPMHPAIAEVQVTDGYDKWYVPADWIYGARTANSTRGGAR